MLYPVLQKTKDSKGHRNKHHQSYRGINTEHVMSDTHFWGDIK